MVLKFLEVLDRAYTGPICDPKNWDVKVIPGRVSEKLKEHDLKGTCDRDNPVNTDDGLADAFWKAGFELAVDTGMLCVDTRRLIKFTDEELKAAIKSTPSEAIWGTGADRVVQRARKPEDKNPPTTSFNALGIHVSEDLFIPIVQSVAQYRIIDTLCNSPVPATIHGRGITSGTPYETLAAKYEATMVKEAMGRAGRPGMGYYGFSVSATEYGQLGAFGIPGGPDYGLVLLFTELKTSVKLLHKTAADIFNRGGMGISGHWSMIGGYAGSPEGCVLTAVASTILQRAVHFSTIYDSNVLDIRHLGNSGREAVWANSVLKQGENRNSNILGYGLTSQTHGVCTHGLLYETAVLAISDTVSGASMEIGTRPTGCKYKDHCSGLENKFAAEVVKSAAGEKRDFANDIAKALIPKYEDKLMHPPIGKSFTECTDLKTLKPTKEWADTYDEVKRELIDLGFPYDY